MGKPYRARIRTSRYHGTMPYRTREEFLDARVAELEAEVRDLKRDRLHAAMKRAERLCIVVGAAAFSGAGVLGAMLFVW